MGKKAIHKEEQASVERYVMLIYCGYCVVLTAITIKSGWELWTAVLLDMCWLVSAFMHIAGFRSYQFRAYVAAGMMQVCIVLWSVCDASLSTTMPALFSMTAMLGLYGIPEIISMMFASTTFLNFYHILISNPDVTVMSLSSQTVLEVLALYFVEYIMYVLIKKRLENTQRQMDVIASLKAAEQSKDDFMANVSHEIRTPINTICGMSEIVLRADLTDEVRADVFSIQTAGRNLLSVVSDVLDFSELQSGSMTVVEEAYNITSTINDIINMSMARKNERRIELIVDCNANIPCSLIGDEQKIRRVIMNLVNNALKFTVEGCVSIIVFARDTDYGINLNVRVKDTGIGMKEESLEKLFTSFNQVDTKRNRQEGGIGLGLAISQAMVEKMGGFITVSSEYGRGSEVQFVIPQRVADCTPIAVVRDTEHLNVVLYVNMEQFRRTEIRDEYTMFMSHLVEQLQMKCHICQNLAELKRRVEREIYSHIFITIVEYDEGREFFDKMSQMTKVIVIIDRPDDAKIQNPKILRLYKPLFILPVVMILNDERIVQGLDENYHYRGRFIAPGTNVLAVDDNLMNIRVLEGLLRPYKIKVSMATSGAEALEKIESMDYDFIFMDHMMPEMDGIETLHRIRQKPGNYFKKIPIIALTANAIGGMREVFLAEGFQDFMAKPIELSVLERVLRRNLPQEKIVHVEEELEEEDTLDGGGQEEDAAREDIWKENIRKENAAGEGTGKENITKENIIEGTAKEGAGKGNITKENIEKEGTVSEGAGKENAAAEGMAKENAAKAGRGRNAADMHTASSAGESQASPAAVPRASSVAKSQASPAAAPRDLSTGESQASPAAVPRASSAGESQALHTAAPQHPSAAAPQAASTAAARKTDLPPGCVNEQMGIRYCGGLKNYIEVLRLNYTEGQGNKNKIQNYYDAKDWKNYTIFVHALKSSMLSIGVEKLSGMAKELEQAGKQDDEAFILEHHDAMMQEYAHILAVMEESRMINPDIKKEDVSGLEALEEAELDKIALEFEDAAFAFDGGRMADIAGRLSNCSYHGHSLKAHMEPVMRKIEMSDYMSASEVVARLKDGLA